MCYERWTSVATHRHCRVPSLRGNVVAGILSDVNFWIAIGTGAAAVAAWRSAFFSHKANELAANAAQAAANAAEATLYRSFQQEYASPEMHDALQRLSEWYWRFKGQNPD